MKYLSFRLDKEIAILKDKLHRRNCQIEDLKERVRSLIASYEFHCPEATTKSEAIKNAKREL